MYRKLLLSVVMLLLMSAPYAFGQCTNETGHTLVFVPIGNINVNTNWTASNVYVLQGPTYVDSGVTLTIDPGTIIKGITGLPPGSVASLIIKQGAKIIADGTPANPIIFTACTDDVSNPNDLGRSDRGLWGSVIILGYAPINGTVTPPNTCPTNFVEGLTPSPNTQYGGCDPTDNSGIIRYVQLKHGGSIIGAANEINGLTFGGVGSGTTVDFVEVFANLDDGYEWFGGNVNCKHLISAFNDDDDFDWDQAFSGKLQFLFAIKDSTNGDRAFEMDSDDANADTQPYARPTVYNVTSIGRGQLPTAPANANAALHFKENTGGHIRNAIFIDWPRNGVFMEDQSGPSFSLTYPDCSILTERDAEYHSRCWNGPYNTNFTPAAPAYANPTFAGAAGTGSDLTIYGTIWWNIGRNAKALPNELTSNQTFTEKRLFTDYPALAVALTGQTWKNVIDNPLFFGMDLSKARFAGQNALDPRPSPKSPAFTEPRKDAPSEDAFFSSAPYAGAFDATNNWACGWTALYQANYFNCATRTTTCFDESGKPVVNVPVGDINKNTNWTNDNVYLLQGPTYVTDSARLTIESGTIIKGVTGLPPGSVSSLIVERNAQLYALGDSCCPIIFTAQTDNINDPNDLGASDRGLWGSVIILGNAPINGTVTPPNLCATNFIEGLTPTPKTEYGGCDAFDNSGVVKWVQLRHGGSIIGAANEINGLTFGGVGSGTTVHHIEVYANLDDGFEWFGGTVNCRYLVSAFNDDDDFDWDQGYNGKLQFLFSIKDSTNGDRAFEMDSDDGNADTQPYARPTVYNVTSFGRGEVLSAVPSNANAALNFKENSGGHIRNAIFYEWPRNGISIEDQSPASFSLAPIPDCTILGGQIDCEYHARCLTGAFNNVNWVGGYNNTNPTYAVSNLDVYGTIWCAINTAAMTQAIVASSQTYTQQRLFTDWPAAGGALASVSGGLWENVIEDPLYWGMDRSKSRFANQNALDPRPGVGGPAFTLGLKNAPSEDPWFASAPYAGAFDATNNWLCCWTNLWHKNYLNCGAPITRKCGDADCNGNINISDAVRLINYIFAGAAAPCTTKNGDADGNGNINISDAVRLINYIFAGAAAPACSVCK